MTRKKTHDEFVNHANRVHSGRYCYTNSVYLGDGKNVNIICSKHGQFSQRANDHLNGHGCPKCRDELTSIRFKSNTQEFINKAIKKYGDKFNYSKVEYRGSKTKVTILCKDHGEFFITPNSHLTGRGCPECKKVMISKRFTVTKDEFLMRVGTLHNHKYQYPYLDGEYVNMSSRITVVCPMHGEYTSSASFHSRSNGCNKCSQELKGGKYSRVNLNRGMFKGLNELNLYHVILENDGEVFEKIGLCKNLNKRMGEFRPYLVREIVTVLLLPIDEAIELETLIKECLSKYQPKIKFGGYSECFRGVLSQAIIRNN